MADEVARLVAVVEANLKGFTKGMEDMRRISDRQFSALERRMQQSQRGFGGMERGLQSLIGRYTSWGFIIGATQRLVRESIEVNEQAAASWQKLDDTLSRLANTAGPLVANFFDGLSDVLEQDIKDLEKLIALWDRITSAFNKGVTIPIGVSPLQPGYNKPATFNKSTRNWMTSPGGFPASGVTDVTPKKQSGKTVAERQAELDIETLRKVEQAVGEIRQQQFEEDQKFRAEQYEASKDIRDRISEEELAALDQFHADANAAWDSYYERQAEMAESAYEERLRQADTFFGSLATLTRSSSDELRAIGKAAAMIQATIDGVVAVQKALASAPPPYNFALAAAVGAAAAANVAEIAGMERGGRVQAGTPYIVGERRPELFVPDTNGTIVPRVPSAVTTSGSISNTTNAPVFNIDARGAQIGVADQITMALKAFERNFPRMMVKAQRDNL